MKTVTASNANRDFSSLLRDVARGHEIVVTSRGKPVARLVPVGTGAVGRDRARSALLTRLAASAISGQTRAWSRDGLYEDDAA